MIIYLRQDMLYNGEEDLKIKVELDDDFGFESKGGYSNSNSMGVLSQRRVMYTLIKGRVLIYRNTSLYPSSSFTLLNIF